MLKDNPKCLKHLVFEKSVSHSIRCSMFLKSLEVQFQCVIISHV